MIEFLNALNLCTTILVGVVPSSTYLRYHDDKILQWQTNSNVDYRVAIDVEISTPKEIFFIGGGFNCFFAPVNYNHTNLPLQNGYTLNTGFRVSVFELGYTHFCSHPAVDPSTNKGNAYARNYIYDEIYLKFEKKFKR